MTWIKDDSVLLFLGMRNTGKSFLVRDFLYHKKNFPIGTIISGTEKESGYYSRLFPSMFIHYEFSSDIVANVSKRQSKVIQTQKQEIKKSIPYDFEWKDRLKTQPYHSDIEYKIQRKPCWIDKSEYNDDKILEVVEEKDNKYYVKWKPEIVPANIDSRAIVLLDDCLYDDAWTKNTNIKEFFMNGRHKDILFMITMQYPLGIKPLLRSNIEYVFILRVNNIRERRVIYENYAGLFKTFDIFCQVMDQCTENYECLVINRAVKSNKIEDQVFWYKAENHEDFQIGAEVYWKYHYEHCNNEVEEDFDNDNDEINDNVKKNKPKINVKRLS